MAKFIPGPLVSEIRNALGAQVFSRNQYGAFTRARVNPDQTLTPSREEARAAMVAANESWQDDLTDQQRVAWSAIADQALIRAHSPIPADLNGPSLFLKLYMLAMWWSGNFLDDPPPDLDTPALDSTTLSLNSDALSLSLTFAPTPVPAGQILMVYATPPLNPGVVRPIRWFKPIVGLTAGTPSPQNIWDEYYTAFGDVAPGKKVFTRCHIAYTYNNLPSVPLQAVATNQGTEFPLLIATKVLTDAQIKALPTTPVEIVAVPGTKQLVPVRASIQVDAAAAAYGNISVGIGEALQINTGPNSLVNTRSTLLLGAATKTTSLVSDRATLDAIPPTTIEPQGTVTTQAAWVANNLRILANNSAGNFTGGNAANSMTVTVWYELIDRI